MEGKVMARLHSRMTCLTKITVTIATLTETATTLATTKSPTEPAKEVLL